MAGAALRLAALRGPSPRRARRRPWRLIPYLLILAVFVAASAAPGLLAPYDPLAGDLLARLLPPGAVAQGHVHWLGTNALGRDELSRLIYGARVSLVTALASVLLAGAVGGILGLLAGYYQRWAGAVLMRLADVFLSIPFLLLAMLAVAVLGPSERNVIAVLAMARWPIYARMAYGGTLKVRKAEFVEAARAIGAGDGRTMLRHILPQVLPSLLVIGTLEIGFMIMFEAALAFLGLGTQPPYPSWGSMLANGQAYIDTAWWLITFPGVAVFLVVLAFNQIGEHVQDRLDPRARSRRS